MRPEQYMFFWGYVFVYIISCKTHSKCKSSAAMNSGYADQRRSGQCNPSRKQPPSTYSGDYPGEVNSLCIFYEFGNLLDDFWQFKGGIPSYGGYLYPLCSPQLYTQVVAIAWCRKLAGSTCKRCRENRRRNSGSFWMGCPWAISAELRHVMRSAIRKNVWQLEPWWFDVIWSLLHRRAPVQI